MTGGAGFIGSAVIRLSIEASYSVVNVDALTYASCLENLSSVSDNPNYSTNMQTSETVESWM